MFFGTRKQDFHIFFGRTSQDSYVLWYKINNCSQYNPKAENNIRIGAADKTIAGTGAGAVAEAVERNIYGSAKLFVWYSLKQ